MRRLLLFALFAASPAVASPQEPVDLEMVGRLRSEVEDSRVMETLWHLTDLYGPRLTNSPAERAAAQWAVERLTEFGLENAALEAWGEFGLGWSYERCVVELCEPSYMSFIAVPKAWTRGTEGAVSGVPVHVAVENAEELEAFRGKLAGKIVLLGAVQDVDSPWEPLARRYDDTGLEEIERFERAGKDDEREDRRAEWRRRRELREALDKVLEEEKPAVVIEPDGGRRNDYGVIMLGSGGSRDPKEPRALPQLVVSTEQFNRVARLLERGHEPVMCVEVAATFHDDDLQGYNIVAEIPGKDPALAHEIVMLGAHFDSWHPATGATDNGAASAVVMEAARLLVAVGAVNRRTIRVALWTGEEQGLLGSRGYVANHFGDRDTMELREEHPLLSAYFNLDNGAGSIRGIYCQENAAVRPIFEAWLEPFHDLGATAVTYKNTGGTDHLSFDAVGLPGFQFIQDPMDYSTRTHHTNMDTYERVHAGDVEQAAVVLAAFVHHAATRAERFPRKPLPEPRETEPAEEPKEETPPDPAPAAPSPAAPAAAPTKERAGG